MFRWLILPVIYCILCWLWVAKPESVKPFLDDVFKDRIFNQNWTGTPTIAIA